MGFSRQELEWVAMPSSGDLPDSGIEPTSLMFPALATGFFTTSATCEHFVEVFIFMPVGLSWLPASSAPSLGYMKQKEKLGNFPSSYLIPRFLVGLPSSLYH